MMWIKWPMERTGALQTSGFASMSLNTAAAVPLVIGSIDGVDSARRGRRQGVTR